MANLGPIKRASALIMGMGAAAWRIMSPLTWRISGSAPWHGRHRPFNVAWRIMGMDPVAREVRIAAGSDQISGLGGAMKIAQLLEDCSAPDAADSVYREVVCFLQFKVARSNHGRIFGPS